MIFWGKFCDPRCSVGRDLTDCSESLICICVLVCGFLFANFFCHNLVVGALDLTLLQFCGFGLRRLYHLSLVTVILRYLFYILFEFLISCFCSYWVLQGRRRMTVLVATNELSFLFFPVGFCFVLVLICVFFLFFFFGDMEVRIVVVLMFVFIWRSFH